MATNVPRKWPSDFPKLLGALAKGRLPDLTTLSVQRLDPATMTPVPSVRLAHGATEFDIPWRWYDARIGYDFPENSDHLDAGRDGYVIAPCQVTSVPTWRDAKV
ncbi:MAG: hypothetical protein ACC645_08005, partial [Pirellulales bacterium]